MDKRISVIIPAYNEENYLKKTVEAILTWPNTVEIIVVNDGSVDHTQRIIEELEKNYKIKGILLEGNRGKGQALTEGIKASTGQIVMFLDADLGGSAANAYPLLYPILSDQADMSIAVLPKAKKKGGLGIVKHVARKGIYYFTGFKPNAPLSGQRAVKKEVFEKVPSLVKGFGIEVGLTIDVLKQGYRIKEVEIFLSHRETGRDIKGFIHRGKELIAVVKALVFQFHKYKGF